eukprot:EG_transcript_38126
MGPGTTRLAIACCAALAACIGSLLCSLLGSSHTAAALQLHRREVSGARAPGLHVPASALGSSAQVRAARRTADALPGSPRSLVAAPTAVPSPRSPAALPGPLAAGVGALAAALLALGLRGGRRGAAPPLLLRQWAAMATA